MSSNPPIRRIPEELKIMIIENLVPDQFHALPTQTHSPNISNSPYTYVQSFVMVYEVTDIRQDLKALEMIDENWATWFRLYIAMKTTFEIDLTFWDIRVMGKLLRPTMQHPGINLDPFPDIIDLTHVRHWAIHVHVETRWLSVDTYSGPTFGILKRILTLPSKPKNGDTAIESIEIKLLNSTLEMPGVPLSALAIELEKCLAGIKGRGLKARSIRLDYKQLGLPLEVKQQLTRGLLEPLRDHMESF